MSLVMMIMILLVVGMSFLCIIPPVEQNMSILREITILVSIILLNLFYV